MTDISGIQQAVQKIAEQTVQDQGKSGTLDKGVASAEDVQKLQAALNQPPADANANGLQQAQEVEKVVAEHLSAKRIYPNVDFYSGVVYTAMGLPPALFTPMFAIARVTGWLAHWLEQLQDNRIYRPDQIYTGKHDVRYVPLEDRA